MTTKTLAVYPLDARQAAEEALAAAYAELASAHTALIHQELAPAERDRWARAGQDPYDVARDRFRLASTAVEKAVRRVHIYVLAEQEGVVFVESEGDMPATAWAGLKPQGVKKPAPRFEMVDHPSQLQKPHLYPDAREWALVALGVQPSTVMGERWRGVLAEAIEAGHALATWVTDKERIEYDAERAGSADLRDGRVAGCIELGGSAFLYFWRVPKGA